MRSVSTRVVVATALVGLAVCWSTAASAHPADRVTKRELVRVQGYKTPPAGAKIVRELVLAVFGTDVRLHATDWQRYSLDSTATETPPELPRLMLQGERDVLDAFASARPDQRITILAEHRPGSDDLFILALDLCPPR